MINGRSAVRVCAAYAVAQERILNVARNQCAITRETRMAWLIAPQFDTRPSAKVEAERIAAGRATASLGEKVLTAFRTRQGRFAAFRAIRGAGRWLAVVNDARPAVCAEVENPCDYLIFSYPLLLSISK